MAISVASTMSSYALEMRAYEDTFRVYILRPSTSPQGTNLHRPWEVYHFLMIGQHFANPTEGNHASSKFGFFELPGLW